MTVITAPAAPARRHVLRCEDHDCAAVEAMLAEAHILREQPGDPRFAYLNERIGKPWGSEYKFYEDVLSEAWLLALEPGSATSTHMHLRKITILVCIAGEGVLTDGEGAAVELVPGTVVTIKPGARHCSSTERGMRLVEFETPRDKFDLVRCEDAAGRAGKGYERSSAEAGPLEPLLPVAGGPPLAQLRRADREYRFGIETGASVSSDPAGLRAAISLDRGAIHRGEFTVVGSQDAGDANARHAYLTIRTGQT